MSKNNQAKQTFLQRQKHGLVTANSGQISLFCTQISTNMRSPVLWYSGGIPPLNMTVVSPSWQLSATQLLTHPLARVGGQGRESERDKTHDMR